jgi:hypothetical protein
VIHLLKTMTFLGAKRGYVLAALTLVAALVGAGTDLSGFAHGDW